MPELDDALEYARICESLGTLSSCWSRAVLTTKSTQQIAVNRAGILNVDRI